MAPDKRPAVEFHPTRNDDEVLAVFGDAKLDAGLIKEALRSVAGIIAVRPQYEAIFVLTRDPKVEWSQLLPVTRGALERFLEERRSRGGARAALA